MGCSCGRCAARVWSTRCWSGARPTRAARPPRGRCCAAGATRTIWPPPSATSARRWSTCTTCSRWWAPGGWPRPGRRAPPWSCTCTTCACSARSAWPRATAGPAFAAMGATRFPAWCSTAAARCPRPRCTPCAGPAPARRLPRGRQVPCPQPVRGGSARSSWAPRPIAWSPSLTTPRGGLRGALECRQRGLRPGRRAALGGEGPGHRDRGGRPVGVPLRAGEGPAAWLGDLVRRLDAPVELLGRVSRDEVSGLLAAAPARCSCPLAITSSRPTRRSRRWPPGFRCWPPPSVVFPS